MKKKVDIVTISFFVITLIVGIVNYINNNGDKVFKAGLLLLVILITNILFTKTFLKKSVIGYYGCLFFEFISIFLANLFSFYNISNYDKFLHLISGIFLVFLGLIIYIELRKKQSDVLCNYENYKKDKILVLFPLFFSIAMAGLWEIWEFTTDNLFGLHAQNNSLLDTMTDIICGTIGACIAAIFILLWKNGKNIKIVKKIIRLK